MGASFSCSSSGATLSTALINRDTDTVRLLLEQDPSLVFWRRLGDGVSPLQVAAALGPLESVDLVVRMAQRLTAHCKTARRSHSTFASILNHKNAAGQTPLMLACKNRHADIVAYLLSHGADPFLFDHLHSKNCLHYAVLSGSASCCRALLDPNVVVRTYDGRFCPLRDASVADSQGYHRYVDGRCLFAFAPLHFAVSLSNIHVLQTLVEAGANLSVRCTGMVTMSPTATPPSWRPFATPLHIAAARRNVPALVQLLASMATGQAVTSQDIRSLPDFLGMRPTDIARRVGLVGMAQLLDPATPLSVVLARLQHVQPQHAVGPATLQQLAATAHRATLNKGLLQLHEQLCKEPADDALTKSVDHGPEGLSAAGSADGSMAEGDGPALLACMTPSRLAHHGRTRSDDTFGAWACNVLEGPAVPSAGMQEWQVRCGVGRSSRAPQPHDMPPASPNSRRTYNNSGTVSTNSSNSMSDHGGTLYRDHVRATSRRLHHENAEAEEDGALLYTQYLRPPQGKVKGKPAVALTTECTICCDGQARLSVQGCAHRMCVQCAMHLADPRAVGPPRCPFCRNVLTAFEAV